ncbi:unnamed protein product [Ectocarpus sp. 13 AM-2016]
MSQMQDTTLAKTEAEKERCRVLQGLQAEHAAARAAARDGLEQARALFRDEELPPEDAESLPLPALLARVRAVASDRRCRQTRLEVELTAALSALAAARREGGESRGVAEQLRAEAGEASARATNAEARVERAEEEATRERGLRATAEASLEACKDRLEAIMVDVEQGQVNLGIMAGERRAAVAKAAELSEQKRLLVREVKLSRRALAEATSVNRRLARAYESLEQSLRTTTSSPVPSSSSFSEEAPPPPSTTTATAATSAASADAAAAAAVGAAADKGGCGTAAAVPSPSEDGACDSEKAVGTAAPVAAARAAGERAVSDSSTDGGGAGLAANPTPLLRPETQEEEAAGAAAAAAAAAGAPVSPVVEGLLGGGGGGGARGGGVGGRGRREEWREARLDCTLVEAGRRSRGSSVGGGGGKGGGGGRESAGSWHGAREGSAPGPGLMMQFRNLSTGDVDVLVPSSEKPRGRASIESGGGDPVESRAPAATFEPHSSNLGLKITQTFAAASWPWAPKPSIEARAATAAAATPAAGTGTAATGNSTAVGAGDSAGARGGRSGSGSSIISGGSAGGGVGEATAGGSGDNCGSDARDGESAAAVTGSAAVDAAAGAGSGGGGGGGYSAFVGAFEGVISSMGSSGGARDGQTVVPSLVLDEDDDDNGLSGDSGGGGGPLPSDTVTDVCGLDGGRPPAASWGGSGEVGGEVAAGGRAVPRRSVGALVCRRCGGTAEGPQNSTCTCLVPELGTGGAEPFDRDENQTTAGLSKLKGVFKSFNGGVKVARQMLDTAVRQNVAHNVPPVVAARSSSGGDRRPSLSSSVHAEATGSSGSDAAAAAATDAAAPARASGVSGVDSTDATAGDRTGGDGVAAAAVIVSRASEDKAFSGDGAGNGTNDGAAAGAATAAGAGAAGAATAVAIAVDPDGSDDAGSVASGDGDDPSEGGGKNGGAATRAAVSTISDTPDDGDDAGGSDGDRAATGATAVVAASILPVSEDEDIAGEEAGAEKEEAEIRTSRSGENDADGGGTLDDYSRSPAEDDGGDADSTPGGGTEATAAGAPEAFIEHAAGVVSDDGTDVAAEARAGAVTSLPAAAAAAVVVPAEAATASAEKREEGEEGQDVATQQRPKPKKSGRRGRRERRR